MLSRRTLFVGGHFVMCALLFLMANYVEQKLHDHTLVCILIFILVFQMTQGSALFVYIAEVSDSDSIPGLCLFILMFGMTLQSFFTTSLLNSKLGLSGMFLVLGLIQVVAVSVLYFFMKETSGLSAMEKKMLYAHDQ